MLRSLTLCLALGALGAAEFVGVTVAASPAAGMLAVTAEDGEAPMRHLPLHRIIDLSPAASYRIADKAVPIKHLALRVTGVDEFGRPAVDVYRIRLSDQSPQAVFRALGEARSR